MARGKSCGAVATAPGGDAFVGRGLVKTGKADEVAAGGWGSPISPGVVRLNSNGGPATMLAFLTCIETVLLSNVE